MAVPAPQHCFLEEPYHIYHISYIIYHILKIILTLLLKLIIIILYSVRAMHNGELG